MILSLVTIKAPLYYSVRVCCFVELTTDYLQDRFFFFDIASMPPLSFPFSPSFLNTRCLISIQGREVSLKIGESNLPRHVWACDKIQENSQHSWIQALMTLLKYFRESFSPSRLCYQKDRYFSLISVVYRLILSLSKDSVSKPLRVEYFTWRSFVEPSIINLKMCEIGSWGNLVLSRSFVRVSKMSIWGTLWIWLCK